MAKENYTKLMYENMKKMSKQEINILKRLGMTAEQISQLKPEEEVFQNYQLAEVQVLEHLINE